MENVYVMLMDWVEGDSLFARSSCSWGDDIEYYSAFLCSWSSVWFLAATNLKCLRIDVTEGYLLADTSPCLVNSSHVTHL